MKFSSLCVDVSMQSSMLDISLPPTFLDTYNLSITSLWCKGLCIVIKFLILWFICLSSSLIYFKNSHKYLTRGVSQEFNLLMRFLQQSLRSRNVLVHLRYTFPIFSFVSACLVVAAYIIPNYNYFFFVQACLFFLDVCFCFLPLCLFTFHYQYGTFFLSNFISIF